MSKCSNAEIINTLSLQKLDQQTEATFTVLTDLESCTTVNFRKFEADGNSIGVFDGYLVPDDMFSCSPRGCVNSGTLTVTGGVGEAVSTSHAIVTDATEFAAGVVTFYVYMREAGTQLFNVTVSDIADNERGNYDGYEVEVAATSSGFAPVTIDLSVVSDFEGGTGWLATSSGIYLTVESPVTEPTDIGFMGLSTLRIFNSKEDFHVNEAVVVGCLTDFSGDLTVDATDSTCFGATYDASTASVEKTIVAGMVTPNYAILSPLARRTDTTEGWYGETVRRVVQEEVRNGITYGVVQLADISVGECGFLLAQLSDNCNIVDGLLSQLSIPVETSLSPREFLRLNNDVLADRGKLLFHESLIGQSLQIRYPKHANVREIVYDGRDMNMRRVMMSIPVRLTDGTIENHIYDNVLITSFPASITPEETTFTFTISAQRDAGKPFYRTQQIVA